VLAAQLARLEGVKAGRDEGKAQGALRYLTEAAWRTEDDRVETDRSSEEDNLLGLAVNAARLRCTVGEISSALEVAYGRHTPIVSAVSGAYSSEYGENADEVVQLRELTATFELDFGRRPRMLVAKIGQDGHDRGQKVIASAFADFGFDVDIGPLFSTADEVVQLAVDSDVHVVGISSQARRYRYII
jgi:methylmalonyl-CoA mutase